MRNDVTSLLDTLLLVVCDTRIGGAGRGRLFGRKGVLQEGSLNAMEDFNYKVLNLLSLEILLIERRFVHTTIPQKHIHEFPYLPLQKIRRSGWLIELVN